MMVRWLQTALTTRLQAIGLTEGSTSPNPKVA